MAAAANWNNLSAVPLVSADPQGLRPNANLANWLIGLGSSFEGASSTGFKVPLDDGLCMRRLMAPHKLYSRYVGALTRQHMRGRSPNNPLELTRLRPHPNPNPKRCLNRKRLV